MKKIKLLVDIIDDRGFLVMKQGETYEIGGEIDRGFFAYHNDFDNLATEFDLSGVGVVFEYVAK